MVTLGNPQYPIAGFCSCGTVVYCTHLEGLQALNGILWLSCSVKTTDSGCV